ncbi:hypothetical protein [Paenibacillus lemnae]|uniref:DUF2975 domain-containing protein n=1 Tax=Paenibacillus lemnae TaxID=1330551 RepID=A0A848MCD7_PAELE|nr:hypothetical protein [Paenibacillus lemnae]NMO97702.1 hypothetical protein [Paenibacillus lemnae]
MKEKYYVLRKLSAAILSSILLSLLLASNFYMSISRQNEDVSPWTFQSLLFVYLIYSLPVILIGGTFFSILIDQIIKYLKISITNILLRVLVYTVVYAVGGLIVITILLFVVIGGSYVEDIRRSLGFYIIGVVGALIYLYLDEGLRAIIMRRKRGIK